MPWDFFKSFHFFIFRLLITVFIEKKDNYQHANGSPSVFVHYLLKYIKHEQLKFLSTHFQMFINIK